MRGRANSPRTPTHRAEGALTYERIHQQADNVRAWIRSEFTGGVIPPAFQQWFTTQDAWTRSQITGNPTSTYWQGLGAIMAQFDGMVAGYNAIAPGDLTLQVWDFQQLNGLGDFLDLIPALIQSGKMTPAQAAHSWDWDNMTDSALIDRVRKTTHCSSLVKTNGDFTQLYAGHVAWFIFQGTIRIMKHFTTRLSNPAVVGNQFSFASYPGYLESLDDYWMVYDSGMWLSETTNSIFNMTLYKTLQPKSLWSWQRIRLVALLAGNATYAAQIMDTESSFTYNNQWIFLDFKQWAAGPGVGKGILPGTLVIYESVPSFGVSLDVSDTLARGYWPSYNVPYIREIYDVSGYREQLTKRMAANGGVMTPDLAGLDYQLAPRAKIFRRDQGAVESFDDYISLMRMNNYQTDPYSGGSPWNAICSRGDLASSPSPDGCYDGKFTSYEHYQRKISTVINGPTTGGLPPGGTLPPFSWAQFPGTSHEGLPDVYNFAFEDMGPIEY
jgi:hypothetical protein